MKKEKHLLLRIAGMVLLITMLTGCEGMELLDEIPRDFIFSEILSGNVERQEEIPEESSAEEAEPEVCFLMEEAFPFSCNTLSREEQLWYHDMERILGSFQEKVRLSGEGIEAGLDETDVDRIFQCVLNDHPELFYVDGYSYTKYMRGERLLAIEFSGSYNTDQETASARREEILAAAEEILAGAAALASDYEKVKYVYETLIRNTDYDLDAPDNQNIYSVFVHHLSVCQGYAKATQYLLNRLGMECTLVLGTVETGEGHAWNLVKVDGEYYYVDTTWGDVSYRTEDLPDEGEGGSLNMPEINYDYLNVTTEEILRTHTIGGLAAMPLCTATGANYYVREGAFFTFYDREQMGALFQKAIEEGRTDVTIKCCDALCYENVVNELIEEQEIFRYLEDGESSIAYAQNEKQLSLTFWVTNE